jgi:hypothetical protein
MFAVSGSRPRQRLAACAGTERRDG